jgi:hypothetical protein
MSTCCPLSVEPVVIVFCSSTLLNSTNLFGTKVQAAREAKVNLSWPPIVNIRIYI